MVALPVNNVDTDQIIPARYLKVTDKAGLGKSLFADWRYNADGSPKPDFILNQPDAQGAAILLAGDNFGCGSSREHAPWALQQFGFKAIIAPSFADIFFNNCFKNGLLPVVLTELEVDHLFNIVTATPGLKINVDLERQVVEVPGAETYKFQVEDFRKQSLLNGWDEIGLTMRHTDKIRAYEASRAQREPWLFS